ncbi:MAG: ABC transporter permease [Labilithrix sp.]|nr:ABC transporter permease [Labilithrix sp.]MCW5816672.1 ABC transporter permease [Labilithrix sp.]
MFWTFGFPLVLSIVLGIAFRNRDPEPVVVAVEASARAEHARALLAAADDVKVKVLPRDDANAALRTGKVSLVVAADEDGYAYRYDPTRPESRLARSVTDDVLQRGEGRKDTFTPETKVVTEPGSRYIDFLIPGLIGLGLMSTGLWGIGFSLAEMRTKKLIKRLTATPMRRSDFLLSFLLVRAVLLPVELVPLLLFARFVFGVGVEGSLATLLVTALVGGLTFAVMGLFLACRAENPQIVSGLINVVSFPMYLCSGVFFSSSRFPDAVQPVIRWMPLTALNDALRATMIDGAGLADVGGKLASVGAWGVVCFVLAVRFFKWR